VILKLGTVLIQIFLGEYEPGPGDGSLSFDLGLADKLQLG
jgi:hypothetical protein